MDFIAAVNTLFVLLLAIVWNRDDLLNKSIKGLMWLLFAVDLFWLLKMSGYVVKVSK